ncbi:MAG: ATP-dependent Clp protease proteolytic subunit [Deltaproteobacteria bacterium]|nr:ATP-dependent Clp protease proteolytic subunit [Deltaproteobacteria bacterium]
MVKKCIIVSIFAITMTGCATTAPLTDTKNGAQSSQEVIVKVQAIDPSKVEVADTNSLNNIVHKSMEVPNQEGTLSHMSFILKDEAFIKIFADLSVGDVSSLWNDISVLKMNTNIRKLNLFINSPGGDAFSGLALADQIERAKREGFTVNAHASGIVASAAVPVFAVCNIRNAAPGTIFMVHETSIWKWPGRETASDIRSQHELMGLLRDRYIGKLTSHSKLTKQDWERLEGNTTWFSAEKAVEYGLVDKVE